jgi:hypothetical protein
MTPLSLFIPYIDNNCMKHIDEVFIINMFLKLDIAYVSSVDIIQTPNKYGYITRSAFVHIYKWIDNYASNNLIEKITDKNSIAKILYCDPYFWILKINNRLSNVTLDYNNDLSEYKTSPIKAPNSITKLILQKPKCYTHSESSVYKTPPITYQLSPPKLNYKPPKKLRTSTLSNETSLRLDIKYIISHNIKNYIKGNKNIYDKLEDITGHEIEYFISLGLVNSKFKKLKEEISILKEKRNDYLDEFLQRYESSFTP